MLLEIGRVRRRNDLLGGQPLVYQVGRVALLCVDVTIQGFNLLFFFKNGVIKGVEAGARLGQVMGGVKSFCFSGRKMEGACRSHGRSPRIVLYCCLI
jgi:hypothetical protein